ncbi:MAG: hypothetical protein E6G56_05805 [Actinobacteria bacterium]|nr:MAG: hypothetical protein E6G56_05805 [Actinomycetota bacterium]
MTDPLDVLRSRARFPSVAPGDSHYESFYIKAAHPDGGQAVWIRHTVWKAPERTPLGSLWVTLFDRDAVAPLALKATYGADRLASGDGSYIRLADATLTPGRADGRAEAAEHEAAWQLSFEATEEPFAYLARPWMYERPIPRTKAISLYPLARLSGRVSIDQRTLELDRWPGMIGHNWGSEHPHRGIWVQGTNFAEAPEACLDAIFGRIKLGPAITPWLGNGCLLLDGRRHRLGGLRPGASRVDEAPTRARFVLRGADVTVEGEVGSEARNFVGWTYANPAGGSHPTLHCSIADMRLAVTARGAPERSLTVRGGAAYELQLPETDHGIPIQPYPDP